MIEEVVDDADDDSTPSSSPPQKRKRVNKQGGGRIPKGKDFWSKVDVYFKEEIKKRGRNFKDARWKV